MKIIIIVVLLTLNLIPVNNVQRQDTTTATAFVLNIGVVEIVDLPTPKHLGLYGYLGASRLLAVSSITTLIPSLNVEWSPELGCWGFVASVAVDVLVSQTLGVDTQLLLVHDQSAFQFSEAKFYLGLGVGVSVNLGNIILSPSINTLYSAGDWSLVPVFNISF